MTSDTIFIIIVLAAALTFTAAVIGMLKKFNSMPGVLPLLIFLSGSFAWVMFHVLYTFEPVPEKALDSLFTLIPAKSFSLAFLFLFSLKYTNSSFRIKPKMLAIVLAVPALTLAACITQRKYCLMFPSIEVVRIFPLKSLEAEKGPWFFINAGYACICLLGSLVLFANHYKQSSVIYKWQSSLFMLGILVFSILDFRSFENGTDGNEGILGLAIMCSVIYFAYLHFKGADLAFLANSGVIEKISSIVLVVENDGKVLFVNTMGKKIFSFTRKNCEGMNYRQLIKQWLKLKNGYISNEDNTHIITVNDSSKSSSRKYYEIINEPVKDKGGKKLGTFVEMRDVTAQRVLISELYYLVNFDQLTGLYNRRFFEEECKNYDSPKYLPLAFISGDLNKLKSVNDNYGHAYGDRLIVLAGEILKKFVPERGSVCRVGGDEFVVIIPNFDEMQAAGYIKRIREYSSKYREEPFGRIDISLGHSVRLSMDKTIEQILKDADFLMYTDKKNYKENMRELARPYHLG
ncbi:MAG: diguanylate cyclase [Clostridiales bacterium]|jgi:diguanylate cyclase (GGDEF)-like protein/PAS domain S-box-containing protein|nr:diguanylate cyclase [Clostridiales bacterium]